jgi:serine/threonine protein kinase/WD40 repeat protein
MCLQFEAVWKEEREPKIEDYLGATEGEERSALLRELLLLDLDYRWRLERPATAEDYRTRFPNDRELIEGLLGRLSTRTMLRAGGTHHHARGQQQPALPSRLGDYELEELLGEGGMGTVYRARQSGVRRTVALKVVRPDRFVGLSRDRFEETIRRFQVEIQAAAGLEHESIVPVYEVGQIEGQPFFSMRYFEGGSLDSVIRQGPLDGREAARVVEKIARAVQHAHSQGVIHRDLKPRNILLDSDGQPYVADFGLAKTKEMQEHLTLSGEVVGTPAYMAPEQARGQASVGMAADIYGLGATLYELITGRPPFRAATVVETHRQVIDNNPVPPRDLNPAIPRDLETICLKCLEKEPRNRYATAEELAEELGRFRQRRPIKARPIGRVQRFWRWCRRNPLDAALSVAVAVSLLVGAGLSGYLAVAFQASQVTATNRAIEADKQRRAAEEQTQIAEDRQREAERQTQIAHAHRFVAHSQAESREHPQLSLLLAIEAVERIRRAGEGTPRVFQQALRDLLSRVGGTPLVQFDDPVKHIAISRGGHWLAAKAGTHIWLCDLRKPARAPVRLPADRLAGNISAISPDGKWLVADRFPETGLAMWDLTEDPLTDPMILEAESRCVRATFSPTGRWIASYCAETGYLWDLAALGLHDQDDVPTESNAGRPLDRESSSVDLPRKPIELQGHKTPIRSMTFSPNGQWLVTLGQHGLVLFWDLASPDPAAKPRVLGGSAPTRNLPFHSFAKFSPDSRWLVIGSMMGLQLWDLREGLDLAASKMLVEDPLPPATVFTSDSRWMITFAPNRACVLWNLVADEFIAMCAFSGFEVESGMGLGALLISPDNRWLALDTGGNTAFLWELQEPWESEPSGRFKLFKLRGHDAPLSGLAFDGNSRYLITSAGDGTIRSWELNSYCPEAPGAELRIAIDRETKVISESESRPDQRVVGSGRMLWDGTGRSPRDVSSTLGAAESGLHLGTAAVSEDGEWLAAGIITDGGRRRGTLFPLKQAHPAANAVTLGTADAPVWIIKAVFSPGDRWLATESSDLSIRLWDFSAKAFAEPKALLPSSLFHFAGEPFSPDGRWLVTLSREQNATQLEIGDLSSFPLHETTLLEAKAQAACHYVFSPNARWLVVSALGKETFLFDLTADPVGSKRTSVPTSGSSSHVHISPDSRWLLTLSGRPQLWDLSAPDPSTEGRTLAGKRTWLTCAAFSLDARWLAVGSADKEVRLWDLTDPHNTTAAIVLGNHEDRIANVQFSPDGSYLVTVAESTSKPVARLWHISADPLRATCTILPWHQESRRPDFDIFFSPDSRWLALAQSTTVMLFSVQFDEAVALARLAVGRELRPAELQQFNLTTPENE